MIPKSKLINNKAGFTANPVAYVWAGAPIEKVSGELEGSLLEKLQNAGTHTLLK